jgi:hypothetical protein
VPDAGLGADQGGVAVVKGKTPRAVHAGRQQPADAPRACGTTHRRIMV